MRKINANRNENRRDGKIIKSKYTTTLFSFNPILTVDRPASALLSFRRSQYLGRLWELFPLLEWTTSVCRCCWTVSSGPTLRIRVLLFGELAARPGRNLWKNNEKCSFLFYFSTYTPFWLSKKKSRNPLILFSSATGTRTSATRL